MENYFQRDSTDESDSYKLGIFFLGALTLLKASFSYMVGLSPKFLSPQERN